MHANRDQTRYNGDKVPGPRLDGFSGISTMQYGEDRFDVSLIFSPGRCRNEDTKIRYTSIHPVCNLAIGIQCDK